MGRDCDRGQRITTGLSMATWSCTQKTTEESLTPNEAAKISGLSPQSYNNALRQLHAQGRLGIYKK